MVYARQQVPDVPAFATPPLPTPATRLNQHRRRGRLREEHPWFQKSSQTSSIISGVRNTYILAVKVHATTRLQCVSLFDET